MRINNRGVHSWQVSVRCEQNGKWRDIELRYALASNSPYKFVSTWMTSSTWHPWAKRLRPQPTPLSWIEMSPARTSDSQAIEKRRRYMCAQSLIHAHTILTFNADSLLRVCIWVGAAIIFTSHIVWRYLVWEQYLFHTHSGAIKIVYRLFFSSSLASIGVPRGLYICLCFAFDFDSMGFLCISQTLCIFFFF